MLKDVLLKEYDIMRSEIRLYIGKYYIAITLIYTILSAGLLKVDPVQSGGIVYIWIPYIIAAIIGFMTMITFYVSKMVGYVRLLEFRMANIFGTVTPTNSESVQKNILLAPLFWESAYADIDMNRDKGKQLTSPFFLSILVMVISAFAALSIIMFSGYQVATKYIIFGKDIAGCFYLITSILLLILAIALFPVVNTTVRRRTIDVVNSAFITNFMLIETMRKDMEEGSPARTPSKTCQDEEESDNPLDLPS